MTSDTSNVKSTYRPTIHPTGRPILPGLGHIRLSLLIGKVLPDLGNLLDPLLPFWIVMFEVGVIDVGVKDHRDRGIFPQRLVSNPLLQLVLRLTARLLGRWWRGLSCWLLLLLLLWLLLWLHLTSLTHHLTPDDLTSGLDHLSSDHLTLHHTLLAHDHPLTSGHHVLCQHLLLTNHLLLLKHGALLIDEAWPHLLLLLLHGWWHLWPHASVHYRLLHSYLLLLWHSRALLLHDRLMELLLRHPRLTWLHARLG